MEQGFCFVIMPFKDEMKGVYEGAIKPAVESLGLECIRVDEIDGSGNVVRRIIERIHEAKAVIADLTGKSANVFYELGIAHALGNNVIVLAQNVKEDVPFDVSNYKVIPYTDTITGGDRLKQAIRSALTTLDEWSKRPSNPVQDFLPPGTRPVPASDYIAMQQKLEAMKQALEKELFDSRADLEKYKATDTAVRQDLEKTQQDLSEMQVKLEAYKAQEDELCRLRDEKVQWQRMWQRLKSFCQSMSVDLGEETDFDVLSSHLEVLLSRCTEKESKITFRKVPDRPQRR